MPDEIKAATLKTDKQSLGGEEASEEVTELRLLEESSEGEVIEVDLSSFVKFELTRGANDSASVDDFEFYVYVLEFTPRKLLLQFEFASPLSISIGSTPDTLKISIL